MNSKLKVEYLSCSVFCRPDNIRCFKCQRLGHTKQSCKNEIACVLGYSGKVINIEHLKKNINSRPKIYLMHGDIDQVVPVNSLLESKHFFEQNDYQISTKIFQQCEHRIPNEGLSIGLEFLKKNLTK